MRTLKAIAFSLLFIASPTFGACLQPNLAGTWEFFHDVNERFYSCTVKLNASGAPIAGSSTCTGRAVDEGLVGSKITGGKLKLQQNCKVTGNLVFGGDSFPISNARLELDRNRAYGYMMWDARPDYNGASPFELIRY